MEMERARRLNDAPDRSGSCIIYWMQATQRACWNHALEYAVESANSKKLPLYVFFGLTGNYPSATLRQYHFMLEGLRETARDLHKRGTGFICRSCDPVEGLLKLCNELNPAMVITDCGHTLVQRQWRRSVAQNIPIPLTEVESDMIVPVWVASDHEETAAWTLRRKITPLLSCFMNPVEERSPCIDSTDLPVHSLSLENIEEVLKLLDIDNSVGPSPVFRGGTGEAEKRWYFFRENLLEKYGRNAREPGVSGTSLLSPYLHFGQISPVKMALEASEGEDSQPFLEQLTVRRELAINFVWYNAGYAGYSSVPGWADRTLAEHLDDPREAVYSLDELEQGKTQDEYWNAAQNEMRETGHMHGYMRMYWGKKVIQWTLHPRTAHSYLVHMNDRYQLDGRDPSGYAGIAWCFGKHDRPFGTFPVTGNLRILGSSLTKMRKTGSSRYNRYLKRIAGRN